MNLVKGSLDALVDAAEVFPAVIRMDLYASILHIFTSMTSHPHHICSEHKLIGLSSYFRHGCLSVGGCPSLATNIQKIHSNHHKDGRRQRW